MSTSSPSSRPNGRKSPAPKNKAPLPPAQAPGDELVRLYARFQRFLGDIIGVLLVAVSLMTLLALIAPSLAGGFLDWWADTLWIWFGYGSLWIVLLLGAGGVWLLFLQHGRQSRRVPWGRIIALEITGLTSLAWLSTLAGTSLEKAEAGMGGRVGWGLAELLRSSFSAIGLAAPFWRILPLTLLLGVSLVVGLPLGRWLLRWLEGLTRAEVHPQQIETFSGSAISEAPLPGSQGHTSLSQPASDSDRKKPAKISPEYRTKVQVSVDQEARAAPPQTRDERLPPLDLLGSEQSYRPDDRTVNQTAGLIVQTLAEFGMPARVIGAQVGPTVTQFHVEPGFIEKDREKEKGRDKDREKDDAPDGQPEVEKNGTESEVARQKVRVSQISALARDLALALSAERLRIEAPVPGRPYIGIEVPNARSTVVRLRPILESEAFYKVGSPLAIALGRDVSGKPVVADLGRMPHLLIAGTTGSGKSVCVAAITACLAMNNTPDDLRLVMIDPKMVELVRFNGLPHLFGKVETEMERILVVLRWVVTEMDRRYKLLEASHSRNIDSFNRKARRRSGVEPLPRIVVLIDELADLMMSAPDVTEHNLVRLAQMARATGIHLVVATQRPSTDVVTGLIKANFPARISFAVASSVDSRVILDTTGAEALLGRGDMLYLPPDATGPVRSQGIMISDQEIERLITYWQRSLPPSEGVITPPWEQMLEEEAVLADRDRLIEQAIKIVQESQRASASLLQRKLRIGYPRAARLIEELEELGVVGPSQGGGREREVLIGKDDEFGRHFQEEEESLE